MMKSKEVKLAVEIAFLFTIVTGVLYIINFIGSIVIDGDFKHLGSLLSYPNLRLIVVIIVIAALAAIINKYYKENPIIVIKKPIVLLISGVLTGIEGIISASIIPAYISTISSNIDILKQHEEYKSSISKSIFSASFSILIILIQIAIAVILILFYKKYSIRNSEELEHSKRII